MRKLFLLAGASFALAAAAWWGLAGRKAPSSPPPEEPPLQRADATPHPGAAPSADPVAQPAPDPRRAGALQRNDEALAALAAGDALAAERGFAAACALDPAETVFRVNLSRARVRLGRASWEAGRRDEALDWFARAAEADSDGGAPAEWRGNVLLRSGDRAAAAAAVEEGLALHPQSAGLLRLRAELAFLRGDLAGAVADARAALAAEDTPAARERLLQLEEEERAFRQFLTDSTAHFDSRYDPQDPALVAQISALHAELERAWTEVLGALGVQPEQRLLVLWLNPERWRGAAPAWSAGLYDGRVRVLVREGGADDPALRATLRHELTHAALHALGARLPTWLHEGLAQRAEGRDATRARARLRAQRRRLTAADLDGDWTAWSDTGRLEEAYDTALSLVEWLDERAGGNALPTLLRAAPRDGFEGAWSRVFVRPFAEWEAEHAAWLAHGRG